MNFNFLLTGGGTGGGFIWIIMIVLIVGMFWFSSRSSKKKEREAAEMRDGLAVGDEVTTIGGIIGKVVSVKGETFVLETTKQKTQIRFLKGAIRSIDVKAADLAAAALEIKDNSANTEASENAAEEVVVESKKNKKNKKKKGEQAEEVTETADYTEVPLEAEVTENTEPEANTEINQ